MTVAVDFRNVDIVFGSDQAGSLALIDSGATRAEILEKTGNVLGCAGASLTVHEGEISVLMGLSGSGKSTLLRAVNRLNVVSRGQVLVKDGDKTVDVVTCDEATLRRLRQKQVAMVFQQFGLLPWRTVEENVGLGLELAGVPEAERKERVHRQLKLVNLDQWAKKYAHELSGGMQQRVGLARAFATEAPILLMDEPFSALDPLIRTKLQDELLQLQAELKKTIIFVSHDLEEALKIGSHITIMEGGRIVQTGAPEDIVLRPANDYVRDFIANVNPLSVLTAWNVMRDRRDLDHGEDGWVWLDRRKTTRFKIDEHGLVAAAERDGKPAFWVSCADVEAQPEETAQVFWANPGTSLKTVMLAMHRSQTAPVALFDDQSRFVGAIGIRDVLSAVLRR
ncbi:choline ABC transporter ATP-binding protein [Mesorhizobium sp. M6A.T.Ce.TU.002.03.1.1]|jgi:glycine betaine/proline transport system ATP-binding protein|uniref:choline ABC transporter ATP-binding protein n=1 Tax=unclassified Mesorhizobium TaxID=325217 RepID=UPI000FCC980A|nr:MULTISPECIES: choline ABC transporter ATP-binding protein [unclassified Mesorhizobium]RUU43698.1 choline ABC transporter ATP-binding protein [Mesorhizobium sp. M6A.T.Ce.TU.002.03.1.1]RUU97461.1 choline ABC transporter ATP-binding protein [Mesorhizobium sp. M6A.T.Cr.TU.017.01.1.1]RWO98842.1 MAG: choline ABC transporter ATP-binding protein [Mesorhizobium sp.]RWP79277.1 MAG: choline ABC transporter ATP-binding protein [Mesorhizobium sp.]